MAHPRRILRLQQLILQTVAQYVQRELRDPRIGLVSITRVKLAQDLSTAAIGWSIMGSDKERKLTEQGLEHAVPAVQRAVAASLSTRITPRIHFRYDETLAKSQQLEEIFEKLRAEKREHGELPDDGDENPEASADDAAADTA